MTRRLPLSVFAAVSIGGLLGYRVAWDEHKIFERPDINSAIPESNPAVTSPPEFVIDDCCFMPGMTQQEILDAMPSQREEHESKTGGQ